MYPYLSFISVFSPDLEKNKGQFYDDFVWKMKSCCLLYLEDKGEKSRYLNICRPNNVLRC